MDVHRVSVRAQDVVPYFYALWCSVGGSDPFANPICGGTWSADGTKIYLFLDTHNVYCVDAEATLDLVPREPSPGERAYAETWKLPQRPGA